MAVHSWLVQCPLLSRKVVGVMLALTLTIIIHVACFSYHDYFTPLNTSIKLSFLLAISKRCLAEPLYSLYRYEDSCNLLPRSLSDVAPGTNVIYQRVTFTFHKASWSPQTALTMLSFLLVNMWNILQARTRTGMVVFPPICIYHVGRLGDG